jgi:hypothetical protein
MNNEGARRKLLRSGSQSAVGRGPEAMSAPQPAVELEQSAGVEERRRVGVVPACAKHSIERLLASLEQLFPVVFEGTQPGALGDLDAVLVLDPAQLGGLPPGLCALVASPPSRAPSESTLVEFASDARVKRPLRGRRLVENRSSIDAGLTFAAGYSALATANGKPVWLCNTDAGAPVHVSTFSPADLEIGETLRDHLRAGRFMGIVPLLHFLRDACGELNWSEQPLRASFVIDDPNLHWPSYGFLNYRDLVAHASKHGYHVGLAMVPLDGWLINRRAASLLRENSDSVSLLVHGNDHSAHELGKLSTDRAAERAIGQGLRRVASVERRSGVSVRRVMAPPHGACSEAAVRAMFRFGFEATCSSRVFPWRVGQPPPPPLQGWRPAEIGAGGLPVLPRYPIDGERDELVFRALLRQPLIIYGHHWDFSQGLDVFAEAADDINALGQVRWGPLDWIASRNYASRQESAVLGVQMYSRKARIDVPEGITALRIETCTGPEEPLWQDVLCGAASARMASRANGWSSGSLEVNPCAEIDVTLPAAVPLEPDLLHDVGPKPWPIARRVLVESRDRARPFLHRSLRTQASNRALKP